MEMDKYIFSVPDSNTNSIGKHVINTRLMNWGLLEAMQEHPEWFYDDFIIETAYGCPSSCVWNGNREMIDVDEFDAGWEKAVLGMYYHFGVRYRLIFTNLLLKKEHLKDAVGNGVAKVVSKLGGYVVVSTNVMAEHMKHYPGLEINWSTSTDFGPTQDSQIKKINELSKKHLVVLPYEFNNKPELKKFLYPKNLEVLINERCIDNCPNRRKHWCAINESILRQGDVRKQTLEDMNCKFPQQYADGGKRFHHISREQLADYQKIGINHFKISGRVEPIMLMDAYKEYFLKPGRISEFSKYINDFVQNFLQNTK